MKTTRQRIILPLLCLGVPSACSWTLLPHQRHSSPSPVPSLSRRTHCPHYMSSLGDFDSYSSTNNNAQNDDNIDDDNRLSDEELEATLEEWDDSVPRFNTVHLTGRIGNDPEPRYLDDGKVVVSLSLAVKRKYNNLERLANNIQSGQEETDWYGLEIWGRTAEFVSKFVDKGMRVGVVGSLQIDQWTDKATQEPRNRVKVLVQQFDVLETRSESEARRGNNSQSSRTGGSSSRGPAFYTSDTNDDNDSGYGSAGTGGFFDD